MPLANLDVPKIVVYSDVNTDVIIESPFELVFNEDAIKKSIEAILTTPYGSRVFRRQFGTKVMELLYEPVDDTTARSLEILIKDMVGMWESRINEVKVTVIPDPKNQQFYVDMRYLIPDLGNKMVSYKFNLAQ